MKKILLLAGFALMSATVLSAQNDGTRKQKRQKNPGRIPRSSIGMEMVRTGLRIPSTI